MKINFKIYSNFIEIRHSNGKQQIVYLTQDSGQLISRDKTGFGGSLVDHRGTILGVDAYGSQIVAHNHFYDFGTSFISTMQVFSKGMQIHYDNPACTNPPMKRIEIALQQVKDGKPYVLAFNDCHTTTSQVCNNTKKSQGKTVLWIAGIVTITAIGVIWYRRKKK